MKSSLCFLASLIFLTGCVSSSPRNAARERAEAVRGCFGTYAAAPRGNDGHTDIPRLLAELKDIHANTYHWLIRNKHEWEDLQSFLPQARRENLKVWVTLLPPSEPPASEPFKLDFQRWAIEIAQLSLQEPNLVAWSIDDFPYNVKLFTPEYVEKMVGDSRKINPKLAFVPCCYFKHIKPGFAKNYGKSLDGILFPYRAESVGANLQDATQVGPEVAKLRKVLGSDCPIILDVYASAHSRLGPSTTDYVEQVMIRGKESCDGVLIYCHQHPERNADKYAVLKKLFALW